MKWSEPISQHEFLMNWTKMEVTLEVSYYNHKSFQIERMLEEYQFECEMSQKDPTSQAMTKLSSTRLFNLNLTYGFVHSMFKVIYDLCPEQPELAED